jgi:hypothetical protein
LVARRNRRLKPDDAEKKPASPEADVPANIAQTRNRCAASLKFNAPRLPPTHSPINPFLWRTRELKELKLPRGPDGCFRRGRIGA